MSKLNRRGPRALSEILGELFTARGYGRLRAMGELEKAWNEAVGEPHCHQTRIGEVRRGVLTVTVGHPALLEELAAFRKGELLEALRRCEAAAAILDLRFRIGPIEAPSDEPEEPRPSASPAKGPGPSSGPARRRRPRGGGARGPDDASA